MARRSSTGASTTSGRSGTPTNPTLVVSNPDRPFECSISVLQAMRIRDDFGPAREPSLGAEDGEEDHVADRFAVGKQHHESVDADAQASGRGHRVP